MNARIEKKVCKRLLEVAPILFKDAWLDTEKTEKAYSEKNCINNLLHIGGEADYWGEGTDHFTLIEFMRMEYHWIGGFPLFEAGHELEGMPNTEGFNPTTVNLIELARRHG